jgi:hypothetical protein
MLQVVPGEVQAQILSLETNHSASSPGDKAGGPRQTACTHRYHALIDTSPNEKPRG